MLELIIVIIIIIIVEGNDFPDWDKESMVVLVKPYLPSFLTGTFVAVLAVSIGALVYIGLLLLLFSLYWFVVVILLKIVVTSCL